MGAMTSANVPRSFLKFIATQSPFLAAVGTIPIFGFSSEKFRCARCKTIENQKPQS